MTLVNGLSRAAFRVRLEAVVATVATAHSGSADERERERERELTCSHFDSSTAPVGSGACAALLHRGKDGARLLVLPTRVKGTFNMFSNDRIRNHETDDTGLSGLG